MERAYDDAKYGDFSRRPYIDMVIPSLTDPSVAPPGKHILSCFVQYAPYKLREGTWDEKREAFGDTVVDTISEYAPNLKKLILHRQVLTPLDLEREFGPHRGQHLPGRADAWSSSSSCGPVPGWARYRTPVQEPLHVRLGHPSRRRDHGRARAHRRPRDAEGLEAGGKVAMKADVVVIGGGPQRPRHRGPAGASGGLKPLVLERRDDRWAAPP